MNGLQKVEFNGTLVLTTQQIAEAYELILKLFKKISAEIKKDTLRANILFALRVKN